MQIRGYATDWDETEGLQPIELQDVLLVTNMGELRKLAEFIADFINDPKRSNEFTKSVKFGDSKPNPKTGIRISVKIQDSHS